MSEYRPKRKLRGWAICVCLNFDAVLASRLRHQLLRDVDRHGHHSGMHHGGRSDFLETERNRVELSSQSQ